MKSYLALIKVTLKLAMRERSVLFFNYFFPLLFFFGFGQFMGARAGGTLTRVIAMVLVIGVLGNGLFGAGMRTVVEREANILRRYRVTPISPLPILVASMVSGWLLYLPAVAIILLLSHFVYGMPFPERPFSLFAILTVGILTFRSLGMVIASVANSLAESNILIQMLYMPMLFISGATIPISAMPGYMQVAAQFLPASYLNTGIQRVLLRGDSILSTLGPVFALIACACFATFISLKLFRWEKEEKIPGKAKAWVAAVLAPFLVLGGWQAYSRDHINETKLLDREIRRNNPRLIRGGRLFLGDGTVLENASVLTKAGVIAEIYTSNPPDPESLGADLVEAAGKTVLPGFIDLHVHLDSPGGLLPKPADYDAEKTIERALEQHLFSGVTAVRPAVMNTAILSSALTFNRGLKLGAQILLGDPSTLNTQIPGPASIGEAYARTLAALAPNTTNPRIPALALAEALTLLRENKSALLSRGFAEQVSAEGVLNATRAALLKPPPYLAAYSKIPADPAAARQALQSALAAGDLAAIGTASGAFTLLHGPTLHRELQLWVAAGVPPKRALQAATGDAARAANAANRMGYIRKGFEASLVVVDGNPLEDIASTERISTVIVRGERIDRQGLFEQK
jgi:ABC-type multidrug transport system permease subunit